MQRCELYIDLAGFVFRSQRHPNISHKILYMCIYTLLCIYISHLYFCKCQPHEVPTWLRTEDNLDNLYPQHIENGVGILRTKVPAIFPTMGRPLPSAIVLLDFSVSSISSGWSSIAMAIWPVVLGWMLECGRCVLHLPIYECTTLAKYFLLLFSLLLVLVRYAG